MNEKVDPQEPGKVSGYKTHEQSKIDLVNKIKDMENQVGELMNEVQLYLDNEEEGYDQWCEGDALLNRGMQDIQVGFMQVVRALFRPVSKLKPM